MLAPKKALTEAEFDALEAAVGADARGFITPDLFNAGLNVLKPLPPDPVTCEPPFVEILEILTVPILSILTLMLDTPALPRSCHAPMLLHSYTHTMYAT